MWFGPCKMDISIRHLDWGGRPSECFERGLLEAAIFSHHSPCRAISARAQESAAVHSRHLFVLVDRQLYASLPPPLPKMRAVWRMLLRKYRGDAHRLSREWYLHLRVTYGSMFDLEDKAGYLYVERISHAIYGYALVEETPSERTIRTPSEWTIRILCTKLDMPSSILERPRFGELLMRRIQDGASAAGIRRLRVESVSNAIGFYRRSRFKFSHQCQKEDPQVTRAFATLPPRFRDLGDSPTIAPLFQLLASQKLCVDNTSAATCFEDGVFMSKCLKPNHAHL